MLNIQINRHLCVDIIYTKNDLTSSCSSTERPAPTKGFSEDRVFSVR